MRSLRGIVGLLRVVIICIIGVRLVLLRVARGAVVARALLRGGLRRLCGVGRIGVLRRLILRRRWHLRFRCFRGSFFGFRHIAARFVFCGGFCLLRKALGFGKALLYGIRQGRLRLCGLRGGVPGVFFVCHKNLLSQSFSLMPFASILILPSKICTPSTRLQTHTATVERPQVRGAPSVATKIWISPRCVLPRLKWMQTASS